LVDIALDLLQRHHAGLSNPRLHVAGHAEAAPTLWCHVKRGLYRKHLTQAADIGHRIANSLIGLEVAVQARLRYLRHRDRDAPRAGFLCQAGLGRTSLAHCCAPFSGMGTLAEPLTSAASSRLSRAAIAASA